MARPSRFSSKVDLTVFAVCLFTAIVISVIPAAARAPIAKGLRRSVMAPLVGLQRGAERWRAAWVAAETQTRTRDSLSIRAFSAVALEAENAQLRRLLGLGSRLQWGFAAGEAVHSAGTTEMYTLTLTAGSRAGVTVGAPVVAPEGIVGKVVSVDPTLSLAITFSHVDFRTSAMTADESAFGIVAPHLGGSEKDSVRYMLEMRGVPFRSEIRPGTVVYSAGVGGIFPRGIPIGTILREIRTTQQSWSRTYLVRPAVNPGNVSSVIIMSRERVKAGIEGVWQMTTALDSAVRGVVAAGDSIRRTDSTATLDAARRRVLDSLSRVAPRPVPDSVWTRDSIARAQQGLPPLPRPATPAPAAGAVAAPPPRAPTTGGTPPATPRRDSVAPRQPTPLPPTPPPADTVRGR